ncbi:MAG: hypothetical protein O3B42_03345 [Actinomycetota bacterium]|nr:hypothetical protein [Actinomycetota bacterium]
MKSSPNESRKRILVAASVGLAVLAVIALVAFGDKSSPRDPMTGESEFDIPVQDPTLVAEVTANAQDGFIGPQILEAFYGDDYLDADIFSEGDEFQLRVFDEIGPQLSPSANLGVMLSVAGLEGRHADSFMAGVKAYLDNNDMSTPGAMENFLVWQYSEAFGKQQEFRAEQSFIGAFGETISQPLRGTSRAFTNVWSNIASPQDAWSNQFLSPGQNVALSAGQDPGTSGYTQMSGTFDGWWNFVGNPVSWAASMS